MRKKRDWCIVAALGFFALTLLWSCAQSPRAADSGASVAAPAGSSAGASSVPRARAGAARLDDPVFSDLPTEARNYLERLARAFASRDTAFLLAQGEAQFEADVRPHYDNESYLALLYRTGAYAAETPRSAQDGKQKLEINRISGIQYLSWKANGPLLEIKARLTGPGGTDIPCLLMLVWRLQEPKIEGLFL
ncbi:MAG: hypothetical protein LBD48_14780 [Treponema sp.]|jgi:hypothetical protein|nr:hypothetical protein [Treponema sp.]